MSVREKEELMGLSTERPYRKTIKKLFGKTRFTLPHRLNLTKEAIHYYRTELDKKNKIKTPLYPVTTSR